MNPEKELLRPVESHELEEKSKVWKYFWSFIGIVLVFLILSYMLTGYTVRSIIAGKANSESVKNNIIESDYGRITFTEGTYEEIKELYYANEKEFKACLLGEYENNEYIINDVYLPKLHFQDYDQVVSSPCPKGTLLDLHSHPQEHCTFSDVDINGFQPEEENVLLSVMCSDDRFIFYKKAI